jgi:hypothetical protein
MLFRTVIKMQPNAPCSNRAVSARLRIQRTVSRDFRPSAYFIKTSVLGLDLIKGLGPFRKQNFLHAVSMTLSVLYLSSELLKSTI